MLASLSFAVLLGQLYSRNLVVQSKEYKLTRAFLPSIGKKSQGPKQGYFLKDLNTKSSSAQMHFIELPESKIPDKAISLSKPRQNANYELSSNSRPVRQKTTTHLTPPTQPSPYALGKVSITMGTVLRTCEA